MSETEGKIYVQLLDGVTVWIPVNAREVEHGSYEILFDEEYADDFGDPFYLQEFYPGDIVELGEQLFSDDKTGGKKAVLVAKKLIKAGQWPDRKFKEFKFKLTLGQLKTDKETATNYHQEIMRARKELSEGPVYGGMLDTLDFLACLV